MPEITRADTSEPTDSGSPFLLIDELARRWRCSPDSIRRYLARKALASVRSPGGRRLIPRSEVLRFEQAQLSGGDE